jgi:preprotein translocase subunit YajC
MEYLQPILIMVVFFAIWYLLLIRPQKKKEREINNMRNSIDVGDNVTTIGGFVGKVVSSRDDVLIIESGPDKVKLKIVRWGISAKQTPGEEE